MTCRQYIVKAMLKFGILLFYDNYVNSQSNPHYICPSHDSVPLQLDLGSEIFSSGSTSTISLSLASTGYDGDVCILSLLSPDAQKPVARTYDGRDWEVSAGPFAGHLDEPSCSDEGICTFNLPVDASALGDDDDKIYMLTSYSHNTSRKAEIARFLEQTTFGPTLAGINSLSETSTDSGSADYASWIEDQMDPTSSGAGISSHREFFRTHTNPRFEYPFPGGGAGPNSACEIQSRWRKFALTERDGIVNMRTNMSKWLSIKRKGDRYIWYVEGMARTSTNSLPSIKNVDGKRIGPLELEPVRYKIDDGRYLNDNMKYSCVGCPVRICGSFGCGYVENPQVHLPGYVGTRLVPYSIVNLPDIMAGDDKMVSIDNGPYLKVLERWQKPNDEFYLNSTIDSRQCIGHPPTILPIPSKIDDIIFWQHPATASPPIFGRTTNRATGKDEFMLFDPIFKFNENTVENPLSDGGGALVKITENEIKEDGQSGKILCSNVPRTFLNEDHCKLSFDPLACSTTSEGESKYGNGKGVVVCGSPGEVASDGKKGVIDGFDLKTMVFGHKNREIYKDGTFTQQKYNIWYYLALNAKDQLRQRMAWALYQIVPIGAKGGFVPLTEPWTIYYDVFVRNAFGNYRNILKEVSFNEMMSNWLSFLGNSGVQYSLDNEDQLHYPDENYAREIMQLFSIGVMQLNMDGTKKLDEDGDIIPTYDSDDIMNYARVWTGFTRQPVRGNVEQKKNYERNDPMFIDKNRRDFFPKSDLSGGYIGDRYPLCADLPQRDFLRKGATFRVLGSRSNPELLEDEESWEIHGVRLELAKSSPLYTKLCAPNGYGDCTFPGKVVLDENLHYDTIAKTGAEYNVDTIRSVKVQSSPVPIFYEYIRPPCVHQNFFNDAQKIIAGSISDNLIVHDSMCADPRNYVAAESCCLHGWETNGDDGIRFCAYNGERVKYSSAIKRCEGNGMEQCNPKKWGEGSACTGTGAYSWSAAKCSIKAKVSFEASHQVARVDHPEPDWAGESNVKNFVRDDTLNFFKVAWNKSEGQIPSSHMSCNSLPFCYGVQDGCVCDTDVVETIAFSSAEAISTKAAVSDSLYIGAFSPDVFDYASYHNLGDCGVAEIEVYARDGGTCGSLDADTIFMITDNYGVKRYLKNMVSNVYITDTDLSFRNPVHFIDFADRSLRDMYYETDAALDTYFYHPSHAPFLSIRIIQRLAGISNPSPQYIERVSSAYKNGSYVGRFGSGTYGDLGALTAAALLDPEARSISLDADPLHGHQREPMIKITSFLRSMDTTFFAPLSAPLYDGADVVHLIGQAPYRAFSVFSFFLPEFAPAGVIDDAGLVSPESQVLDSRLINLLNGLYSTVKFGLSMCYGGLGSKNLGAACPKREGVITEDALGMTMYTGESAHTIDDILDELSLLLTCSRLSLRNRNIIKSAVERFYGGDKAKGIRIAQQLIISTPEFHTTNLAQQTGNPRYVSSYRHSPAQGYKAVVFFMMEGGADSFNLIVPKGNCKEGKDMFQEYSRARGRVALDASELLDIDASGSGQICDKFGVNNDFPLLHTLYNEGKAIFFANTGVLSKPLTKYDDWMKESKIQLFAHNHMRQENYKIDPLKEIPGTGVGGRMLDFLRRQGYHTSANMVDGSSIFAKGTPFDKNPTWNVDIRAPELIDRYSTVGPEMLELVKQLNGESESGNSLYGETFSSRIVQSLFEYKEGLKMNELMDNAEFQMNEYPNRGSTINKRLRAVAQFMKMRGERKVNRETYIVKHDEYDMHSANTLGQNFKEANDALHLFISELKRQGIWEDTVIVMGSEFGRSITSNSNGGTDHAWAGNYFMIGGSVNGGKILGEYPEHLSALSSQWIGRGRMIPTLPWESVWNGVANWMGVRGDDDLNSVLPNRDNFDKCSLFTDEDLFIEWKVSHSSCSISDKDGDGVPDDIDECPNTTYSDRDKVNNVGCVNGVTKAPSPAMVSPTPAPFSNQPISGPTSAPVAQQPSSPIPVPTTNPMSAHTEMPTMTPIDAAYTPVNTIIGPGSNVMYTGSSKTGSAVNIFDGTCKKVTITTDRFTVGEPGVIITPVVPFTIVKGIRVYTSNNYKSRDPTKYIVEGRNEPEDSWDLIFSGGLSLSRYRNYAEGVIISSPTHGDPNRRHNQNMFPNDEVYSQYRVTFPETKGDDSAVSMAELELPGLIAHNGPGTVDPTPSPVVSTDFPSPGSTASPTLEPTVQTTQTPTKISTPSPTSSPTKDTTSAPSKATTSGPGPTQTPIEEPTLILSPTKDPTLSPTADSTPTKVNTVIDLKSNITSVGTETPMIVDKACDGTTNALTFKRALGQNPGLIAEPSHSFSIVKGIRVYNGPNYKSRDPTKYIVEGRNGYEDSWHMISEGGITMGRRRNPKGILISSTFSEGDTSLRFREVSFENDVAYSQYKVTFPEAKDGGTRVLVAEVELPGIVGPSRTEASF